MAAAALLRVGLPTPAKLQMMDRETRFRATAVIREHSHNASTTESASWHTDAVSLFTGPVTGWIGFSTSLLRTTGKDAMGQYQPAVNNETPLAGDDLNSNVIVNAQLTHVVSRDDALQGQDASNVSDVRCQTYRQCMTLLYQDASLEDDAANGASVHNLPQVNASVLPATCVEYDSRLQQWGNRETNHHYIHAHCVNGGLGHDHELFPKQATDQDEVDAVTRQRDTITRTAADTEVLLPCAHDLDQASTAAPPDDERDFFGREEPLRMDEEIMDI